MTRAQFVRLASAKGAKWYREDGSGISRGIIKNVEFHVVGDPKDCIVRVFSMTKAERKAAWREHRYIKEMDQKHDEDPLTFLVRCLGYGVTIKGVEA